MLGRALSLTFFRETKKVTKIVMNDGVFAIGSIRFSFPEKQEKTAYLHKIEIFKTYRNQGFGTYLLNRCESFIEKKHPYTEKISAVLWDNQTDPFVQDFFAKNNYKINHREVCLYDDGESMFDILPMEKKLKSSNIIYL